MTKEEQTKFNQLVQRAHEAFENDEISKTLDALEAAYDMDQTAELNQFVTKVLLSDGQNQLAHTIADEFVDSYTQTRDLAEQYLELALRNKHYLIAREFALATKWNADLEPKIIEQEELDRQEFTQTIQTTARHFYHLSEGDLGQQQERLTAAEHLPLREYLVGAKFTLVDPFLLPITRATVLDRLRRLKLDEQLKMLWFDGSEIKVNPSKLVALDETPIFKQMMSILEENEMKIDSTTIQALEAGLRLHLLIAYPKLEDVVKDPQTWVLGMLAETKGEDFTDEPEAQKKIRQQLQAIILTLMQ